MMGLAVAAATQLAFLTSAQQAGTGVCSGEVKLQLQDAAGQPVSPAGATLLTLTGPATFFDNSQCAGNALDTGEGVAVQPGRSTLSLWVLAVKAGQLTFGAAAPGLTAASQTWTVAFSPGVPTAVAAASKTVAASAGACSGPVAVELRDANAGPAKATRALVAALEPSNFLEFWGDAACQTQRLHQLDFAQGAGGAAFYLRSSTAVSAAHVRVTVPGLDGSDTLVSFAQPSTGCAGGGLAGAWALLPLLALRRRTPSRRSRGSRAHGRRG